MGADNVGDILGAGVAQFYSISVEDFIQFRVLGEVGVQKFEEFLPYICGDIL